jgi:MFS family permease
MSEATLTLAPASSQLTSEERKVLVAASLGTVFEWYDFVLFGSLAGLIGQHFFSKADPSIAFIFALLAFSAGFIVRPLGAIVFGRLGDLVGRKYTFLVTIVLMGLATFAVGLLPGYDAIGLLAPAVLVSLRMLQGLAVGGEYGGAVIYVAEHATKNRRGFFTSWIQVTGTAGFILSLVVVLFTRLSLGEPAFAAWGWRLPFLLSIFLLAISVWIRMSLEESPVFKQMKSHGTLSKAPLSEAFGRWQNVKYVLASLFGLIAGFGVVWYTTQFYTLLFLTQTLKVDPVTANVIVVIALVLATPFFVVFGSLSDRIGRKKIVLSGILLAALAFYPAFRGLTHFGNPALERAIATAPVMLVADPATCSFQFNLTGTSKFTTPCDVAKSKLAALSVSYKIQAAPAGTAPTVMIGGEPVALSDLAAAVQARGYPAKADPAQVNAFMLTLIVFILVFFLTMAYGPVAAMLVEMFPTRIRYTSMSLPYHIGTGWFGGLTPTFAFALVAATGDIYSGLWFPIVICSATVLIGALIIPETKDFDINR